MIDRHDFNSAWWGRPVGIVRDEQWFDLPPAQRQAELAHYAWVEFKSPQPAHDPSRYTSAGFRLTDTQISFRIALDRIEETPSTLKLDCVAASTRPFQLDAASMADFQHERFAHLQGVTADRITRRFAAWAGQLVQAHPDWALEIAYEGQTQGWFVAEPTSKGLYLALAMLARGATVSGANLYRKALHHFAAQGQRIGHAGFSASNTAVLNIYSQFGARFTAAHGAWLWQADNLSS
jgi:hypothetical protein